MDSIVPSLNSLPVGFRFRPTEEELVNHYLKPKLLHDNVPTSIIPVFDLCKVEPWEVPGMSEIKSDEEWFFFNPVCYKYQNSKRVDRGTKCGFWKPTGNERYIRARGTNNVIGAKKTLVFYEGCTSDGSKSNWVIHEYYVKDLEESQKTYVLCRLMKKDNIKSRGKVDALTSDEGESSAHNQATVTKGGIDALVSDEGEPSRNMGSDIENQATPEGISYVDTLPEMDMVTMFKAREQAEYLPAIPQSPIAVDQEASFTNSTFPNACFRNEDTSFETTQMEEFLNSIMADENFVFDEESVLTFANGSPQLESSKRVYFESSDIEANAEVIFEMADNLVDSSTECNEHLKSSELRASKIIKSSHGAVHSVPCHLPSIHKANQEINESTTFQDDLYGVEASSCDSTVDKPLEINCIEISSSSTLRRCKNQRRSQKQKKVSSNVASCLGVRKSREFEN
ncbi:hypothetical protein RJT34_17457 [Clitoria ternatea]|uniref:NAC domain-containing protein n=1 Tax=Clitoria ternatea TaxID=43366 RepID=A0AAN9JB66_CLITE